MTMSSYDSIIAARARLVEGALRATLWDFIAQVANCPVIGGDGGYEAYQANLGLIKALHEKLGALIDEESEWNI